jgi:hypothetical protein
VRTLIDNVMKVVLIVVMMKLQFVLIPCDAAVGTHSASILLNELLKTFFFGAGLQIVIERRGTIF